MDKIDKLFQICDATDATDENDLDFAIAVFHVGQLENILTRKKIVVIALLSNME